MGKHWWYELVSPSVTWPRESTDHQHFLNAISDIARAYLNYHVPWEVIVFWSRVVSLVFSLHRFSSLDFVKSAKILPLCKITERQTFQKIILINETQAYNTLSCQFEPKQDFGCKEHSWRSTLVVRVGELDRCFMSWSTKRFENCNDNFGVGFEHEQWKLKLLEKSDLFDLKKKKDKFLWISGGRRKKIRTETKTLHKRCDIFQVSSKNFIKLSEVL